MKSNTILKERAKKLKKFLKQRQLNACLIDDPVDLLYLTGLTLSAGTLLVSQEKTILFVDGRYLQVAQASSPFPVLLISKAQIEAHLLELSPKVLSFDSAKTSYADFVDMQAFKKKVKKLQLKPFPNLLQELRVVKDEEEKKQLQLSANLLWEGFEHIQKILKVGMQEKEVAFHFEMYCKKEGAEGLAFESIIAFGENSAMPHHRAGERRLKKGDIVLVDIGVIVNHYHSDMTRVIFFGEEDPLLKKYYEIIQRAQKAAMEMCRSGVLAKELDEAAREVMRKEGVESYFTHSLGHGIGLETHEFPRISLKEKAILKTGMVITIEPGLYLPGRGGVRYEDMVLVSEKGCKRFTGKNL